MTKRSRRALIKLLVETSGYEEGSRAGTPGAHELAEVRERWNAVGGDWVAKHRGLIGREPRGRLAALARPR